MGCCLSKTDPRSLNPPTTQNHHPPLNESKNPQTTTISTQSEIKTKKCPSEPVRKEEKTSVEDVEVGEKLSSSGGGGARKEVFVIQHRKSNDRRTEPKASSSSSSSSSNSTVSEGVSKAVASDSCEREKKINQNPKNEAIAANIMSMAANGGVVRTSSCTKEEVDAILIQCGRLSRSSSGKGGSGGGSGVTVSGSGRKYSGSKRSHDFDRENNEVTMELKCDDDSGAAADVDDERHRRRQSRGSHRRRTPSRSRERDQHQQQQATQRSGSKERAGGNGTGRRVSRSPGRRSESPITTNNGNPANSGASSGKPGKMVSVPATVSSLSVEKSSDSGDGVNNNGGGGNVKRVLVKRNAGANEGPLRSNASPRRSRSPARRGGGIEGGDGSAAAPSSRGVASPRSRSPARSNGSNGLKGGNEGGNNNGPQNQGSSLSRNSSRKAEHSPYRRTPLNELDMNSLPFQPLANKGSSNNKQKSKEVEEEVVVANKQPLGLVSQGKSNVNLSNGKVGVHRRSRSRGAEGTDAINFCRVNETSQSKCTTDQLLTDDKMKASNHDSVVKSGNDTLKLPQTITRSRSLRRSRDFDVDSLLNPSPPPPTSDYNSILLQDIQKFHQKGSTNPNPNPNPCTNTKTNVCFTPSTSPFTLPASLSKACSIVEAVADLNSSTNSNMSYNFSDDREKNPAAELSSSKNMMRNCYSAANPVAGDGKKRDRTVESEVNAGGNDMVEPSFHKYVTVRRRGIEDSEAEEESSGSNSFVGGNSSHQYQQWGVSNSSSWEPNSADSTDRWTSKSREERSVH